ncbi:MAG TPA: polymer-forming cytoskeletal protein [Methanoregulaceae archaeon]|nr:polymer-forming cytoskeletal protein [Methanoregulaceae archaeon]HOV67094.1 polymer-forming cytoskeletal protein [Methanoregulaceae archaeon]HQJ87679.1 polymer-forming cytoskeletal protein [Methanoregulaceae archaeon]
MGPARLKRSGDLYIAEKGAVFDGNLRVPGDLVLPPDCHVWGDLVVNGRLDLGPHGTVGGRVYCRDGMIGHHAVIRGPLTGSGKITVADGAQVQGIETTGTVVLRPGVRVGDVRTAGLILIHGRITSGLLVGRQVKVFGNG